MTETDHKSSEDAATIQRPTEGGGSPHSLANKLARTLWGAAWLLLFRPSPRVCHFWRRWLLRLFGAKIASGARVYSSCRIWAPWHLEMAADSCLGDHVDCYDIDRIYIGKSAVVSQYSYLCTAGHPLEDMSVNILKPIRIEADAWVAADCFVGMGVTVGEGAVVGARASVFKNVQPWTVVAGNPARFMRHRPRPADAAKNGDSQGCA